MSWRAGAVATQETARLSWRTEDRHFEVTWEETRGLPNREPEDAPETGSLTSSLQATNRALAMPLLARIMTAHRGSLAWTSKPGFKVILRWPLEQQARVESA